VVEINVAELNLVLNVPGKTVQDKGRPELVEVTNE